MRTVIVTDYVLQQIIDKARDANAGAYDVLSTGEKLAAAIVLNRADWLQESGYTITEALERLGAEWVSKLPIAAKHLATEIAAQRDAAEGASAGLALARAESHRSPIDGAIHCRATLVTTSSAPGYRNPGLVLDLLPMGAQEPFRVDVRFGPEDSESIFRHIREVHQIAWGGRRGKPIDFKPGETRPTWID